MAARCLTVSVFSLVFLSLAGCQQDPVSPVRTVVPRPNLDGPSVVVRSVPTPPSAIVVPQHVQPPVATARPEIPAGWVPPVSGHQWKWIVIHHSATPVGSAAVFDREHRAKGWDELGYHFVIGNGTYSGDGQIEVGPRWDKQKWGAHAKTLDNRFNDFGIGICVVGNFEIDRPTPAQMRSLTKLVTYLMETYHIPPSNVLGHGDTKPTDCPGRNFPVASVRAEAAHRLALTPQRDRQAVATPPELMRDSNPAAKAFKR